MEHFNDVSPQRQSSIILSTKASSSIQSSHSVRQETQKLINEIGLMPDLKAQVLALQQIAMRLAGSLDRLKTPKKKVATTLYMSA